MVRVAVGRMGGRRDRQDGRGILLSTVGCCRLVKRSDGPSCTLACAKYKLQDDTDAQSRRKITIVPRSQPKDLPPRDLHSCPACGRMRKQITSTSTAVWALSKGIFVVLTSQSEPY